MPKFKVQLTRTVHQTIEVEIEADNEAFAKAIALETAGDYDFSGREKDAEYDADIAKRAEYEIMNDIVDCYSELSPENLTHDGERSNAEVRAAEREIHKRLKALQKELGKDVPEGEAWAWSMGKCRRHG